MLIAALGRGDKAMKIKFTSKRLGQESITVVDTERHSFNIAQLNGRPANHEFWVRIREDISMVRFCMDLACGSNPWEADVDLWDVFGDEIHAMRVEGGRKGGDLYRSFPRS